MDTTYILRNFLAIPYDQLEEMNITNRNKAAIAALDELHNSHLNYLTKEKRIKAVTLCFSDIEGKLHMLDYDKKYFLDSHDNLTFDGSSVRGFTALHESDLRLRTDWTSMRFLPSDVFGPGKIIFFADVLHCDRKPYGSDIRLLLKQETERLFKTSRMKALASTEIEGFVVAGIDAEQQYDEQQGFRFISEGGYYHSLPLDPLRAFIDRAAEAQRAMGFRNEKDHPEVAPSQFELNFAYDEALRACDNIQLYKLTCRQVANTMGMTATFLPKPVAGINGSGMHLNFSIQKNNRNIFFDAKGRDGLSKLAWDSINKLLNHAPEICLMFNSSVNAYRRLDPHFEAPNQIKVSPVDRGSMIRIPVGNEKSARIEIRSVAPDANPYLVLLAVIKTILAGQQLVKPVNKRARVRTLPGTMQDAMRVFKVSAFTDMIMGTENKNKYLKLKESSADRSPKELGTVVKRSEVIYHHEVTNQLLWNAF